MIFRMNMSSMNIIQKISFALLLALLPVIYLLTNMEVKQSHDAGKINAEIHGVSDINRLYDAVSKIGVVLQSADPQSDRTKAVAALNVLLKENTENYTRQIPNGGKTGTRTRKQLDAISLVINTAIQDAADPDKNISAALTAVTNVFDQMVNVEADQAGLVLDGRLDSYYLMDNIVFEFPVIYGRLFEMAPYLRRLAAGETLSAADMTALGQRKGEMQTALDWMVDSFGISLENMGDPAVRTSLSTLSTRAENTLRNLGALVDKTMAGEKIPAPEYASAMRDSLSVLDEAHDATMAGLTKLLNERLEQSRYDLREAMISSIAIFALGGVLMILFTQTYVSRPLRGLLRRFKQDTGANLRVFEEAAYRLTTVTQTIQRASLDTSNLAGEAAVAVAEAAGSVSKAAGAVTQLVHTSNSVAEEAERSAHVATQATEIAASAEKAVHELSALAEEIETVVSVISSIARQTNLLSMNATVEAAHAGDMGKGFAIVASEVKKLSGETADATKQIASQIRGVQNAVTGTTELIGNISEILKRMSESNQSILEGVRGNTQTSAFIKSTIETAAERADQVSEHILSVSQAAENNQKSAEALVESEAQISKETRNLKIGLETFSQNLNAMAG